jgi:hypothetical protein
VNIFRVMVALWVCSGVACAQHQHHFTGMKKSATAKLEVRDDPPAQQLTVRIGPLKLPAHATHMTVAQAPSFFLGIPFDGWIVGYHPRIVDGAAKSAPGRLLHHVAFYNVGRHDFLCPAKLEHVFGAGGEMNDWPLVPGFGYRVHPGDRIRIDSMFHNPTAVDYPDSYLEVKLDYRTIAGGQALKDVYPAWFDVEECGSSGYDLPAGISRETGEIKLKYSGRLLGVGGHLHDYGSELDFENVTRGEDIAKLRAKLDSAGHMESMPVVLFLKSGGYKLNAGDVLKVTATYNNTSGKMLPDGAMGIVVGYFIPRDEGAMAALKVVPEKPKNLRIMEPASKH